MMESVVEVGYASVYHATSTSSTGAAVTTALPNFSSVTLLITAFMASLVRAAV
ncbi:MAG: hypothetical protein QF535_14130 [Anaerolineales bacterium]|nr:hypothetical protein [Anaerolineales bacterium]